MQSIVYFQLRYCITLQVASFRHLLSTDLAQTLACNLIMTRLDYCNSVLNVVSVVDASAVWHGTASVPGGRFWLHRSAHAASGCHFLLGESGNHEQRDLT